MEGTRGDAEGGEEIGDPVGGLPRGDPAGGLPRGDPVGVLIGIVVIVVDPVTMR